MRKETAVIFSFTGNEVVDEFFYGHRTIGETCILNGKNGITPVFAEHDVVAALQCCIVLDVFVKLKLIGRGNERFQCS